MEWSKCANCDKYWPVDSVVIGEAKENHRVATPNQPIISICPECIQWQDETCEELGIEKTSDKLKKHEKN